MKKNIIRMISAVFVLVLMFALTANASAAIKKVSYKGNGKMEVDFTPKVNYKQVKVTVKNAKGKKVKTVIVDKDNDNLEFTLASFTQGERYSFTISGVKKRSEKKYSSVKGSILIPKTKGSVPIKEVEYDRKDKEVELEFSANVEWKKPVVKITDGKKQYVIRIKERNRREIEVKVKALQKGKTYQYTISGIRKAGSKTYTTISGSFKA